MPEPMIYNAAEVAIREHEAAIKGYVPPVERPEQRDAIWNFEQIPGQIQEQTDLRAWGNRPREMKLELVKAWGKNMNTKREGEDPTARTFRRKKMLRRLLFVIVTEADQPLGSREVAAEAFKAIFPKE